MTDHAEDEYLYDIHNIAGLVDFKAYCLGVAAINAVAAVVVAGAFWLFG